MATKTFFIRKGPSKFDLAVSFFSFLAGSNDNRISVRFEDEDGNKMFVTLNQISWADSSGENWDFQGTCWRDRLLVFAGQYNTETKKGQLNFL